MKKPITTRQQEILDFISHQVQMRGYPPSVREIGAAVGLSSTASVHNQLNQLEKKGFIRKDKSTTRGLVVLGTGKNAVKNAAKHFAGQIVEVPLLGKKAAGSPLEAFKNPNEYFQLPASLVPPKGKVFVLTAQGDDMVNAGIHDGDQLIVKESKTANDGEIVVAMIKDEDKLTVKTYYQEAGQIRLQPENDALEPFISQDIEVIGKVIGLYRQIG